MKKVRGVFHKGARFGKLVLLGQKGDSLTFRCDCGNILHTSRPTMKGINAPISCGCTDVSGYPYKNNKETINRERAVDKNPMRLTDSISELTDKWIREFENEERVSNINREFKTDYVFRTVPRRSKRNTSGRVGVHYNQSWGKWVAQIVFRGKYIYLGARDNFEDAVKLRAEAEQRLFSPSITSKNNLYYS